MNVVIRVDASTQIGSGHVMRCLTLATQLRREGIEAAFVCRTLPGDLCGFIEEKGFRVHRLAAQAAVTAAGSHSLVFGTDTRMDWTQTAEILRRDGCNVDWLVVDHYGLDVAWERCLRPYVGRIFVIDDLANRAHDCDGLLDQNLHEDAARRYVGLVPPHCAVFIGPEYALLREEFCKARAKAGTRDGRVRRILVFFGGGDSTNETVKAFEALRLSGQQDIAVDVVVGSANPQREVVRTLCRQMPHVTYHCQVDNIAELMVSADLAIGAGGSTTWERCYLGLPALTIITAENQLDTTMALASAGATWNLGWFHEVDAGTLARAVADACSRPEVLREMSARATQLIGTDAEGSRARMLHCILGAAGSSNRAC